MHHLTSLFLFFLCSSKLFQIPPQCTIYHPCFHFFSAVPNLFKYRHNAQFTILVYIFFCSFKSFKIPSQCTLQLHSVNLFLCSSKFPVLQFLPSVNMHAFRDNVSKMFSAFSNHFKYPHNVCFRDIVFIFFSAVPNRYKYHQNAYFRDIVLKITHFFSAVLKKEKR